MRNPFVLPVLAIAAWLAPGSSAADRPDIVVADFEGDTYGDWKTVGDAFGQGPAQGALPGQMALMGFLGKGLVNSFHGGDDSTGSLTSPAFKIERASLNFLIGGGHNPGETCVNLILDGKIARTATGPNKQPGGTEALDWISWDISDLAGKSAQLTVIDHKTGGWGHINVDQVVQSDKKRGSALAVRSLVAKRRYLHLPVRGDAPSRRVKVDADGKLVDEFDIKLAEDRPDFLVFLDLARHPHSTLSISSLLPLESKALDTITAADELPNSATIYKEPLRPGFHFTSKRGWLNDPNGLVYLDGEYHLFYQQNPYGWDWGNMHWGHAVSLDLIHWSELPIALMPKVYNDWCFSGSAVVDKDNTSGFGDGKTPAIVAAFTSTGRGECIVYSNDRGRTWSEFEGNPVLKHAGRDPRLLWFAPAKRWIMAVYDETDGRRDIVFHSSADLRNWTRESLISGFYECPDFFELPVEGDPGQFRWVLSAADGQYLLGAFDGHVFTPENPKKERLWFGNTYAAQTFSNAPNGRRIQIGWGNGITFPGMPFNQQMTMPCELTLRKTPAGLRLFTNPVKELQTLEAKIVRTEGEGSTHPADPAPITLVSDYFRIKAEADIAPGGALTLKARGVPIVYDGKAKTLTVGKVVAPFTPEGTLLKLDVLVDRGSIEVFGNDGTIAISAAALMEEGEASHAVSFTVSGEGSKKRAFTITELKSAW